MLAAFVGGLVFNLVSTGSDRSAELSIDEAVNRFAVLPLFVVLGAVLPWSGWYDLGWRGLALAVAILLLRRLPVLLLLARPLQLRLRDAVYLGWFGPIGVSALFYLTLEAKRFHVPDVVLTAGSLVLVTSTVAHGLTSAPDGSGTRARPTRTRPPERTAHVPRPTSDARLPTSRLAPYGRTSQPETCATGVPGRDRPGAPADVTTVGGQADR